MAAPARLFAPGNYGKIACTKEPGGSSMRSTFIKIVLVGMFAAASLAPALATKHEKKLTGACAQSSGRCIADCDNLNWCAMYTCTNGRSTPVPFWRCFEPSGLCLAPHC
jgi:hypothetical protein